MKKEMRGLGKESRKPQRKRGRDRENLKKRYYDLENNSLDQPFSQAPFNWGGACWASVSERDLNN